MPSRWSWDATRSLSSPPPPQVCDSWNELANQENNKQTNPELPRSRRSSGRKIITSAFFRIHGSLWGLLRGRGLFESPMKTPAATYQAAQANMRVEDLLDGTGIKGAPVMCKAEHC